MPVFGVLSVWVVTPTGVPFAEVEPVIVTEMPVAEPWFAVTPPLVKVAEHAPAESVQTPFAGVKTPVGLLVAKVTAPDGDEPVTVTKHVANLPTFTEDGEHETLTVVEAFATMFSEAEPSLAALCESPE